MSTCKLMSEYIAEAREKLEEQYPDMDSKTIDAQINALQEKINRRVDAKSNAKIDGMEPQIVEFNSPSGEKIDFSKDSYSQVLSATMLADQNKVKEVLHALMDIDENKLSEDHRRLIESTIDELIDWNKDTMPEMIQRINTNAELTGGSIRLEDGKNGPKGLSVRVNPRINNSYLHVNGAETYAHEVMHAAVEFAQKYHAGDVVQTMNDISGVYDQFMDVVTVEDFMPSKENSVDAVDERRRAEGFMNILLDKDTGINEFIVMSKTNMLVHDILTNKVRMKKKEYDTSTLWKKLMAAIHKLIDTARRISRGNDEDISGSDAMSKYILELNQANQGAAKRIKKYNQAITAASDIVGWLNKKGHKYILKLINKVQEITGDAILDSETFNSLSGVDKVKKFTKTLAYFMAHPNSRGQFEAWLELLPFGIGLPEGTLQQLIIKFRDKDSVSAAVEEVGLQSQKLEREVNKVMTVQSEMIDSVFDQKLTKAESESLTKIIAELDIEILIDNGSKENGATDVDAIKMSEFADILEDDKKRKELIVKKMNRLKEITKDEKHYNFMGSQILGLADYLVTGEAGRAQLANSGSIVGKVGLTDSITDIVSIGENDIAVEQMNLVDQLVSLEALELASNEAKAKTAEIIRREPQAMEAVINYMRGMAETEKDMFKDSWQYDFFRVKGSLEKSGASWINLKTANLSETDKLYKEGYTLIDGMTAEEGYGVFVNKSHGQASFEYEGIRATNFGRKVNSLIDGYKETLRTENENISLADMEKKIEKELKNREIKTHAEMIQLTRSIRKPTKSGSMPIYKLGVKGKVYVTDYDVTINKQLKEEHMLVRDGFSAVIGKTLSRFYDMVGSKKINDQMLDILFKDMDDNYELGQSYFNGGKENNMTYVKIGPDEKSDLSNEIWPILPRYMKAKILQNHRKKTIERLIELGKNNEKLGEMVIDKNIKALQNEIEKEPLYEKRIRLGNKADMLIYKNIRKAIKSKGILKLDKDSLEKVREIEYSRPHVAVRRNLVYHYFGNREATLGDSNGVLGKVIRSNRFTREGVGLVGTIVKELASTKKVDVVLRNIPTLRGNVSSNYILNTLKGNNPLKEFQKQSEGFSELAKYQKIEEQLNQEKIRLKSVNEDDSNADAQRSKIEKRIKTYEARLKRNLANPLVEAGLFTGVAEDLTNEDLFKRTYVQTKIDSALDWIPDGVRKVLDNLYITQRTPVYKGLLLFMQYSDFAARYSRYYKMISEGISHEKAIREVTDNQVNYGEGHGKLLQWLNKFYILSFTKFAEGMQRPLRQLATDKPFSAAMGALMYGIVGGNDNPLAHSIFTKDYANFVHSPSELLTVFTDKPEAYAVMTGSYKY